MKFILRSEQTGVDHQQVYSMVTDAFSQTLKSHQVTQKPLVTIQMKRREPAQQG